MKTLSQEDADKIYEYISDSIESGGSKFPGMTWEQGLDDMLNLLEGNMTVDELCDN